jgi:hypothetical protein
MSYGSVIEETGSAGSDYLYFTNGHYAAEPLSSRRTPATTEPTTPVARPIAA